MRPPLERMATVPGEWTAGDVVKLLLAVVLILSPVLWMVFQ